MKLIFILIVIIASGCASSGNIDSLVRREATNQRRIAQLERELQEERARRLRIALGDEVPADEPRTAMVRIEGELGMPNPPVPAPMPPAPPPPVMRPPLFAPPGVPPGFIRTPSPVYVGTSPPWHATGERGGEVAIQLGVQRFAVRIGAGGYFMPMLDGGQPSMIAVETIIRGQRTTVQTPAVRGDGRWAYFLSPEESVSVRYTCFEILPGTGTFREVADWTRNVTPGTPVNRTVFDHTCEAHRRR